MTTIIPTLYDLNDLAVSAELISIHPVTGKETPLATGNPAVFLSTTKAGDTPAEETLVGVANYSVGSAWTVTVSGAVLIPATPLDAIGATGASGRHCYLIIRLSPHVPMYIELVYGGPKAAQVS